MPHFTYTRANGQWAPNSVVYSQEMANLDAKLFKAINGDEGGVWAPSTNIVIGGQGLRTTGPLNAVGAFTASGTTLIKSPGSLTTEAGAKAEFYGLVTAWNKVTLHNDVLAKADMAVEGTFYANADAYCTKSLYVTQNTKISGTLDVTGALSAGSVDTMGALSAGMVTCNALDTDGLVSCASLFSLGAATVKGELNVIGTSDLHGATHCHDTLGVDGKVTAAGGIDIGAASTLTAPLTPSGQGRVRKRVAIGPDAAGKVYGPADADIVIVPALNNDRIYQTSNDAADGDEIEFVNLSSTNALSVWYYTGVTYAAAELKNASGNSMSCRMIFYSGAWYVVSISRR